MISANAALPGSYDYGEVARSVLIAVAASYAGLDFAGRVTAARGRARLVWLSGGAVAMGIGIWAMHLKGMLAFRLPVSVAYHWPTILAAFLVAIFASAVALYVASGQKMGPVEALTGSVFMGAGIAGLHYLGMAAMRLPAFIRYSPLLVTCSILLAILFSVIALLMAFDLREETKWTVPRRLGTGIVMGAAVSAMHYTGMAAASFIPALPPNLSHAVNISPLGNDGIAIVTLIVIVAAITTSSVERRASAEVRRINEDLERGVAERALQLEAVNRELRKEIVERERAEEGVRRSEDRLRLVIDTIPHQIWSGPPDGSLDFCNAQWLSYMGFTQEEAQGEGWQRMLHPDDRERLQSGSPNPDELRTAITEIVNDATRASAVISRIRGLLTKGTPRRTDLDVNQIIQEVITLLRNELSRNRISLSTDLASGLPCVPGDPVQLQQVLINLIMNAVEAMRTSTGRPGELLIRSARKPDGVLVQVQDSGPGIAPELGDRIFEPFFTTKAKGTGMGLSISRSIIESHGGQLSLVPASQGALFQVALPVDRNDVS